MASGHATLHELNTVYGTEDLYDMLELIVVSNHNQKLLAEARRKQSPK